MLIEYLKFLIKYHRRLLSILSLLRENYLSASSVFVRLTTPVEVAGSYSGEGVESSLTQYGIFVY